MESTYQDKNPLRVHDPEPISDATDFTDKPSSPNDRKISRRDAFLPIAALLAASFTGVLGAKTLGALFGSPSEAGIYQIPLSDLSPVTSISLLRPHAPLDDKHISAPELDELLNVLFSMRKSFDLVVQRGRGAKVQLSFILAENEAITPAQFILLSETLIGAQRAVDTHAIPAVSRIQAFTRTSQYLSANGLRVVSSDNSSEVLASSLVASQDGERWLFLSTDIVGQNLQAVMEILAGVNAPFHFGAFINGFILNMDGNAGTVENVSLRIPADREISRELIVQTTNELRKLRLVTPEISMIDDNSGETIGRIPLMERVEAAGINSDKTFSVADVHLFTGVGQNPKKLTLG